MAKRAYSGRSVGTGVVVGGGTLALGAWSPMAGAAVLCVAILLALTVAVVVLTAARSSDRQKQLNSAAVLDSLLFRSGFDQVAPEFCEDVLGPQGPVNAFLGNRQQGVRRRDPWLVAFPIGKATSHGNAVKGR